MQLSNTRENRAAESSIDSAIARFTPFHIPVLLLVSIGTAVMALLNSGTAILGWRPSDMASIALNYYRHGFHFFYPQVNWGGNGPGYVEMEFPIVPYFTALLYKFFGVHEWLGLIIPIVSGIGLVLCIYLFSRLVFDPAVGFVAGLFAAVSPTLMALSTGLWPDPAMIFSGALGLYALTVWVKKGTLFHFFLGAFGITAAILLKLTALYFGFPVLYLCIVKYPSVWWRRLDVWLLGLLILIPPFLWYWHAFTLFREYHNTFGILSAGYLKFGSLEILSRPGFYTLNIVKAALYHITPAAFAALLYGLTVRYTNRVSYVFHVWLGALVIYILVSARGVMIGHYQYLLPVVAPAAAFAGVGTMGVLRRLESQTRQARRPEKLKSLAFACVGVFLANAIFALVLFDSRGLHNISSYWRGEKRTGLAVGTVTQPGSFIIVADGQMDEFSPDRSMTPPDVFYFSDRRGWYVALSWLRPELIEKLKDQGGRYFVITGNALAEFTESYGHIEGYLSGRYTRVLKSAEGYVYDLSLARGAEAMH